MKLISKESLNIKKIEKNNNEDLKYENNKIINEENLAFYLNKVNDEDKKENIQYNEVVTDMVMQQFVKILSTNEAQTKIMDIITKNQNLLNSLASKFMQSFTIKIEKKEVKK